MEKKYRKIQLSNSFKISLALLGFICITCACVSPLNANNSQALETTLHFIHRPVLLAPHGLRPMLKIKPAGGLEQLTNPAGSVRLTLVLTLAGQPMEDVLVEVFETRAFRQVLWKGSSDNNGSVRPILPVCTAGRRLPIRVHCHQARPANWTRLVWDPNSGTTTVHWDSTPLVSTAQLDKWELQCGTTHVYFDWPNRQGAQEVLNQLINQRRSVHKFLGVPTEPMGAILLTNPDQRKQFITTDGNRTRRIGKFIHGIRTWPLQGATLAELQKAPDEEKELYITLAHELAENTLLAPNCTGIEHLGTRWFRDGVAECAAIASAWTARPATLARHLKTRANHLKDALKAGRKTTNLLNWKQDNDNFVNYAVAAAWFLKLQRQSPGIVGRVVSRAAQEDQACSAELLRYLARATNQDVQNQLKNVNVKNSLQILQQAIADLNAGLPFGKTQNSDKYTKNNFNTVLIRKLTLLNLTDF